MKKYLLLLLFLLSCENELKNNTIITKCIKEQSFQVVHFRALVTHTHCLEEILFLYKDNKYFQIMELKEVDKNQVNEKHFN